MADERGLSLRLPWRWTGAAEKLLVRKSASGISGGLQEEGGRIREAVNMDLHCDCAESPAAEQPSGKINKTAFKLFGKRKSGSAMPAIFGVKTKVESKNTGKMGMVRSKTLDGLAEVVLESSSGSKKEEQDAEEAAVAATPTTDKAKPDASSTTGTIKDDSSFAKSHSFFNLLKKGGRSETVRSENAEQKAVSRQKKGLKGLFNSMRWNRKEKIYKDDREASTENPPGLILPGSLTASLECVKEQIQKPLCEIEKDKETLDGDSSSEEHNGDVKASSVVEHGEKDIVESPCSSSHSVDNEPQEEEAPNGQHVENLTKLPDLEVKGPSEEEDENRTGCGDIIADHDEDGGSSALARIVAGNGKRPIVKKTPIIVAYQGGGEEMASPDQVDDTDIQDIWGLASRSNDPSTETDKTSGQSQAAGQVNHCADVLSDGNLVKPSKLKPVAKSRNEKGNQQKIIGREQKECIRNSDEGYWDSTTSGPEEEPSRIVAKKALPRDSCSGDALYDLYREPDENTASAHATEEIPGLPRSKPLSPVTVTCPGKTSFAKDSKIPISIKHLPVHPPSQGADSSGTSAAQHPVKTELPKTKIPVSKVLVRRVSNKSVITGTSGKLVYHDLARK
uniref:APC membrane recruitment protein 2 n=1 Tax=Leptobrachium leishanense TaxID=445787 RepID=A0A8C5LSH4_9ANUR